MPIYQRKDSEVWWIDVVVPGHPRVRRSAGTLDRTEAQRIHDEIKAALWKQPKQTGYNWGDAVARWVDAKPRSDSDLQSLVKFGKQFADRPLVQITAKDIEKALAFCESPATYNRYVSRINAILNLAVEEGLVNAVPRLKPRHVEKKERVWITLEQWNRLFVHLPEHQRVMVKFALETGLRQSNVLNLTWDRVDLERRFVWIDATQAKAKKAIPVPLSDGAYALLLAQKGKHEQFVFVFRGAPITEVKTAFKNACIKAKLGHYDEDGKWVGFTWHGLRHTWATWHIQNGTPIDVLQKLGAWADLRMVMNYSHHDPGYLAGFANNVRKKK